MHRLKNPSIRKSDNDKTMRKETRLMKKTETPHSGMLEKIMAVIPHITYMMSVVYIVLLIFDRINASMVFINNSITKNSLFVYTALVIVQSVYGIVKSRGKSTAASGGNKKK